MKNFKIAIFQAIAIVAVAVVAALVFNTLSPKGINPFKRPAHVPVSRESAQVQDGGIKIIPLDEARQAVESGVSVIDARRKADFDNGHIPGAMLLDYYDMATYKDQVLPRLKRDQLIMVYCSELSCDDSELLAKELYALGFTKLVVFKGGFAEWSAAGLPVERSAQ
jgi:rhodanese-related sulfurtransferase